MEGERRIRSLGAWDRSLEAALSLGPALVEEARRDRAPWIAASVVIGPAVVLGAAQRAGRVVDLDACARASLRVLRRATTGTAAYLGGRSIVWTLALPDVAALIPDASPRSLLNRNVRGFLRGFRAAGAVAHYFGREWISVAHRPAALLGFDVAEGGEVLIEVLAGFDDSIRLPDELAAEEERAIDRWQGKSPASLASLARADQSPTGFARCVLESVASQAGAALDVIDINSIGMGPAVKPVLSPLDPIPDGLVPGPPRRVPIGWVEAAASPAEAGSPRRAWLGGDALAPLWALSSIARAAASGEERRSPSGEIALDGATERDLLDAVSSALRG